MFDKDQIPPITPPLVKGALLDAFPGVEVVESTAIGRRLVYKVEFREFSLVVTTPEHDRMKKHTTLMFRRVVGRHKILNVTEQYEVEDSEQLKAKIRWARAYVMGILAAWTGVFQERTGSPAIDITR